MLVGKGLNFKHIVLIWFSLTHPKDTDALWKEEKKTCESK